MATERASGPGGQQPDLGGQQPDRDSLEHTPTILCTALGASSDGTPAGPPAPPMVMPATITQAQTTAELDIGSLAGADPAQHSVLIGLTRYMGQESLLSEAEEPLSSESFARGSMTAEGLLGGSGHHHLGMDRTFYDVHDDAFDKPRTSAAAHPAPPPKVEEPTPPSEAPAAPVLTKSKSSLYRLFGSKAVEAAHQSMHGSRIAPASGDLSAAAQAGGLPGKSGGISLADAAGLEPAPATARSKLDTTLIRAMSFVRKNPGTAVTKSGDLVRLASRRKSSMVERSGALINITYWTSYHNRFTGKYSIRHSWEAMHPSCPLRLLWNNFVTLLLLWIAVVIPVDTGFDLQSIAIKRIDIFVSAAFFLDVFLSFCTGYRVGGTQDHVELRLVHVAKHYLFTWFAYDVAVALPWVEVLEAATGAQPSGLFYLVRLARLLRMAKHFRKEPSSGGSFLPWHTIKFSMRSILMFVFTIMLSAHMMACGWMLFITLNDNLEDTWGFAYGLDPSVDSILSMYITALYYAVTIMSTIGFGDIKPNNGPERGFAILAMLMGSWGYAYCVTQLVSMIANMSLADVKYEKYADLLMEYMAARNVPISLRRRVLAYYEFQRHHAAVFHQEREILSNLPPSLHSEVKGFVNQGTVGLLRKIALFKDLDELIVMKLVVQLETQFLPPGELVCVEGEVGAHLYIIRKGTLKVRIKGRQVALLGDGEFFGEVSLYHNRGRRTATVLTGTYCQIFSLAKSVMDTTFAPHPDVFAQIKTKARKLWNESYAKNTRRPSEMLMETKDGRTSASTAAGVEASEDASGSSESRKSLRSQNTGLESLNERLQAMEASIARLTTLLESRPRAVSEAEEPVPLLAQTPSIDNQLAQQHLATMEPMVTRGPTLAKNVTFCGDRRAGVDSQDNTDHGIG